MKEQEVLEYMVYMEMDSWYPRPRWAKGEEKCNAGIQDPDGQKDTRLCMYAWTHVHTITYMNTYVRIHACMQVL